MEITFLKLAITNFGVYKEKQVIDLTFSPEEGNIVLFFGKNGQGKTTILDAIRLVLYGEWANCSSRGKMPYKAYLSEAVNYDATDDELAKIELTFDYKQYPESCTFRVERSWKRGTKDTLKVYRNDELDDALGNNWQEWINGALPVGISSLFLFDGEQVRELAEADIPTAQMRESIDELLGLKLPQILLKDLEVLAKRKRSELANSEQLQELDEFEQEILAFNKKIAAIDAELIAKREELENLQNKLKTANQKFITEGGQAASEQATLQKNLQLLEDRVREKRDRLRELAAGKLPLAYILPLLEQAEQNLTEAIELSNHQVAQQQIDRNNKRLLDRLRSMNLDSDQLTEIERFMLKELTPELNLDSSAAIFDNDPDLARFLGLTLAGMPDAIREAQSTIDSIATDREDMVSIERRLAVAAPDEIFKKLDLEVKNLHTQVVLATTEMQNLEDQKAKLNHSRNEIINRLQGYADRVLALKDTEHKLTAIARAKESTNKYIAVIKSKRLNALENAIALQYRALLHKSDFIDSCTIDPDTYAVTLYKDNKILPRHRLSAGEKQILAIAIFHGLAQVSKRQFPVVIDTPLGRLDTLHRRSLVEKYFQNASHQVVLLSTDTEITESDLLYLKFSGSIAKQYKLEFSNSQRKTLVSELVVL